MVFQLGIVAAAAFLVLGGLAVWRAAMAARRRVGYARTSPLRGWPRSLERSQARSSRRRTADAMMWLTLRLIAAEAGTTTS